MDKAAGTLVTRESLDSAAADEEDGPIDGEAAAVAAVDCKWTASTDGRCMAVVSPRTGVSD